MTIFVTYPKVVAALQPRAEISERLRRKADGLVSRPFQSGGVIIRPETIVLGRIGPNRNDDNTPCPG